jgi:hypothetical protein
LSSGAWARRGEEKATIVKRDSALMYQTFEQRIPIGRNHSDLAKLDSRVDNTYDMIVTHIDAYVNEIVESQGALGAQNPENISAY